MPHELRKYINMVLQEELDDVLHEMAILGSNFHGIQDVVIWIGKTNKQHGLRVKISNVKNRWSEDNFVIMLPSLDYDPTQVAKWITADKMKQIKQWLVLNQQVLYDFETDKIMFTDQLIAQLSKI
jgi:hypothetical protein